MQNKNSKIDLFDEAQVRKFYKYLGHQEYDGVTVLVALSPDGKIASGFFDSENLFLEACRRFNGEANLYAGLNPRKKDISPSMNVMIPRGQTGDKSTIIGKTTFFIDIDVKKDPGKPSTDAQLAQALEIAHEISSKIGNSTVCISGNGAYVLAKLGLETDVDDLTGRHRQFLRDLRDEYSDSGIEIDVKVHDSTRICAVMGTLKMKGVEDEEHPYRLAKFVNEPDLRVSESLLESLLQITPALTYPQDEKWLSGHYSASERPLCTGLENILNSSHQVTDCSRVLFAFLTSMKFQDWKEEDIYLEMEKPASKIKHPNGTPARYATLSPGRKKQWIEYNLKQAHAHPRPCKIVGEVLGCLNCKNECPVDGKGLSCGRYQISDAPDKKNGKTYSLEEARLKMREEVSGRIEDLVANRKVLILKYPPGSGKNHLVADLLKNRKTIWLTSRKIELEKIDEDLAGGLPHQVIRSKEELCPHRRFEPYRSKSYFYREREVCAQCAEVETCPYKLQFDASKTLLMPTRYLTTGIFGHPKLDPEIVVVDEASLSDLLEKTEISASDLVEFKAYMKKRGWENEDLSELIDSLIEVMGSPHPERKVLSQLSDSIANPTRAITRILNSEAMHNFRKAAREEPVSELPSGRVPALINELARDTNWNGLNSRICVQNTRFVIRRFHNMDHLFRFPIIVLDASAEDKIYEKLFPHREIEYLDLPIKIKAEITQITNSPMGRENYLKNPENFQKVVDFIKENGTGQVGIICHKKYEDELRREFPEAVMGHYGSIRGSREFEGCDSLFLVGGYFINPEELKRQAESLYWDEEFIDDFSHKVARDYGRKNKNKQIWGLYEYDDPRMNALAKAYQEEEMRQAAFRIRPLEGKKKIFILSNLPISGLAPQKLIKLEAKWKEVDYRTFYQHVSYLNRKKKPFTVSTLARHFGISYKTAKKLYSRLQ